MKTLYQRLTKANKDKLKAAAKLYPSTISLLLIELKSTMYWHELTIDAGNSAVKFTTEKEFNMLNVAQLFEE